MNAKKDRLIEIIKSIPHGMQTFGDVAENLYIENVMVKHLIDKGVDIPLCKPGDVLYSIVDCTHRPEKIYVTSVHMYKKYDSITALSKGQREYVFEDNDFGKVVFYTEDEALEALNKKE